MSLRISYSILFSSCNLARSEFGDAFLLIHDLHALLQHKYAQCMYFITITDKHQIQGIVRFFDLQG